MWGAGRGIQGEDGEIVWGESEKKPEGEVGACEPNQRSR